MLGRAVRTLSRTPSSRPSTNPRSSTSTSPRFAARTSSVESASYPSRRNPRAVTSASRLSSSITSTCTRGCPESSASVSRAKASSTSSSRRSTGGVVPSASASSSSAFSLASVDRSRCRGCDRSALGEPVSDSTYGLDPAWFAKSSANLVHRLLNAVLEPRVRAAPGPFQQLRPRDHLAGPFRQDVERRQRPALELEGSAVECGLHLRHVQPQPTAHGNAPGRRPPVSQHAAYPCQQALPVCALGDVVRGPAFDPDDLITGRGSRPGQDDDRECKSLGAGAQLIQHLGCVHVRHLVVEQHQVRSSRSHRREGLATTERYVNCVAGTPQQLCCDFGCARFVVDNEQPGGRAHPRLRS